MDLRFEEMPLDVADAPSPEIAVVANVEEASIVEFDGVHWNLSHVNPDVVLEYFFVQCYETAIVAGKRYSAIASSDAAQ